MTSSREVTRPAPALRQPETRPAAPDGGPAVLEARAIGHDYPPGRRGGSPLQALDGVSFAVPRGAFVALVGPSGCGKTTLLRMVNRLIEPTSGAITREGEDIRKLEPVQLRRRIGYVIQQVGLFPHMTVAQNIAVVPELLGWSRERIEARVHELLELVALPAGEYCARYPAQLSGGQQQRVAIARAIVTRPTVLFADEPTGNLDSARSHEIMELLTGLNGEQGVTIVMVTHEQDMAAYAGRIVRFVDGRVESDEPNVRDA